MLSNLVYHLASSKGKITMASLVGLGGASIYYGTLKPSYQNQVEKVIGSEALRDKNRTSFLDDEAYSSFYINSSRNEVGKNIPSFDNYLKKEHLTKEKKAEFESLFSPEMREHIQVDAKEQRFIWATRNIRRAVRNLEKYSYDIVLMDDRDISEKSVEHIEELQKIQKSQFIQDIVWSLAEESEFNKTLIRPESISITTELEPPEKYMTERDNIEIDGFPAPTSKISNLNISLKVFNPNRVYKHLFKQILLKPFSENVINIRLEKGEIKLLTRNSNIFGFKSASWGLNPMNNKKFEVQINQTYPFEITSEEQLEDLDLLFSNSKYINSTTAAGAYAHIGQGINSLPIVTYKDIQNATTSLLIKITPEQIKKDIEHWYGAYYIHWWRLRLIDIKNFFSIIQKNIFFTNKGKQVSIIDKMFTDAAFRNNYYTHLHLNNDYRKVLDLLFTDKGQEVKFEANDFKALLNAWSYQIDQILDAIKVKLTWKQTPSLSYGSLEDDSPFKTVSFEFSQEVSWDKDISLPIKGTYNFKEKKFENSTEDTGDTSNGDKVKFDFSSKLSQINALLLPLQGTIIKQTEIAGINIFQKLLPDVGKFVGWEKFEIKKEEKITTTYKAISSPIRPASDKKLDAYDHNTKGANLGWKALDIEVSKDLNHFHNIFYDIYEKIDLHNENGTPLGLTEILSIQEKLKDKPISMVAHIVNSIWDKKYGKGKRGDGEKRPWKTFFETLFQKPLVLKSTQFFVGYSHAYYDIPDWYLQAFKSDSKESTTENETTYKSSVNIDQTIKDNNKSKGLDVPDFPAEAKTEKIKEIGDKMGFFYSSFYPRIPIIIGAGMWEGRYREFLEKEGSTTVGLINNEEKLKSILREKYIKYRGPNLDTTEKYYYFPKGNDIPWEKAKVSLMRLDIEKALSSILAMDHTLKGFVASTALSVADIKIYDLLGQAIQRDGFVLNVNLMSDMGSFSAKDNPIKRIDYSPFSELGEYIEPKIDDKKFNLGNIRGK